MKLYNTLTNKKEVFTPLEQNKVKLYVCGITPYDTTHLGHAFTYTTFDVLYRFLNFQNYAVNYTQNVTDIDDDILKKAKEVGKDWKTLGQFWTDKYVTDMRKLNTIPPTHYVKATETMPMIIKIITTLIADGYAYVRDGNVYFAIQKVPTYGKLSNYTREQMLLLSKERGADPDDEHKIDTLDFVLWQMSKSDEPFWESPWSKGRPGWHIECTAMVYKYLGKKIDIHGGGGDLRYPHHESEIAQSESFTGQKPFSQFWMHTGTVMYAGEKMSKSLGNLVLVSDLLKKYSPNAIRYLLLTHHYRTPWEYHEEDLQKTQKVITVIESKIKQTLNAEGNQTDNDLVNQFTQALSDDLDTPKTLAVLNEAVANNYLPEAKKMMEVLGFTL